MSAWSGSNGSSLSTAPQFLEVGRPGQRERFRVVRHWTLSTHPPVRGDQARVYAKLAACFAIATHAFGSGSRSPSWSVPQELPDLVEEPPGAEEPDDQARGQEEPADAGHQLNRLRISQDCGSRIRSAPRVGIDFEPALVISASCRWIGASGRTLGPLAAFQAAA